jgi:hypothetical protein
MKKIIFISAMMSLMVFNMFTVNAQVNYSVTFGWNDSNCDCNEPVTMEGWIIINEYPGGTNVVTTGWFTMTTNPFTYSNSSSGLRDCVDEHPCYTVYDYVRYKDNTGTCCSGSGSENTTGQDLFSGYFTLTNQIILN